MNYDVFISYSRKHFDEVMYASNTGKKIIPVLLKGARLKGWFLFKFGRVVNIQDINGISEWKSKYPAFAWCYDLGHEWSLPAVDDYKEMLEDKTTRDALNAMLSKHVEKEVFDKSRWFWSSLENNNHASYYIYCSEEFHADTLNKSNCCFISYSRKHTAGFVYPRRCLI